MKRGDLYLVRKPGRDTKKRRAFAVVSRQDFIDTRFSTVICAPVYSRILGLSTEVAVGIAEGLKGEGAIHADALASVPKSMLTDYVGRLGPAKLAELDQALRIALAVE
jgi:mRNA interferase MazF